MKSPKRVTTNQIWCIESAILLYWNVLFHSSPIRWQKTYSFGASTSLYLSKCPFHNLMNNRQVMWSQIVPQKDSWIIFIYTMRANIMKVYTYWIKKSLKSMLDVPALMYIFKHLLGFEVLPHILVWSAGLPAHPVL